MSSCHFLIMPSLWMPLMMLVTACWARMAYVLPSEAKSIMNGRSHSKDFSCVGRPYGYYADVANDCQIFHICQPIETTSARSGEIAHFSFVCANQTIFSQDTLTCTYESQAFPCQYAESLYEHANAEFGFFHKIRSDDSFEQFDEVDPADDSISIEISLDVDEKSDEPQHHAIVFPDHDVKKTRARNVNPSFDATSIIIPHDKVFGLKITGNKLPQSSLQTLLESSISELTDSHISGQLTKPQLIDLNKERLEQTIPLRSSSFVEELSSQPEITINLESPSTSNNVFEASDEETESSQ